MLRTICCVAEKEYNQVVFFFPQCIKFIQFFFCGQVTTSSIYHHLDQSTGLMAVAWQPSHAHLWFERSKVISFQESKNFYCLSKSDSNFILTRIQVLQSKRQVVALCIKEPWNLVEWKYTLSLMVVSKWGVTAVCLCCLFKHSPVLCVICKKAVKLSTIWHSTTKDMYSVL